jgi:molecular chaperone GrpE
MGTPDSSFPHGDSPAPQERYAKADGHGDDAVAADAAVTIADLHARADALQQELRRALADAGNTRKRFDRQAGRIREQERAAVAQRWLPVVDNLDRALEYAGADPARIIDGVRAVRDQAVRVLAELGFPRRDDTGEKFDPARHNAEARTALALCAACPVRAECLEFALRHRRGVGRHGIWGGLVEAERASAYRGWAAGAPVETLLR